MARRFFLLVMMADQRLSRSHSSVQPFRLLIDDNGPPPPSIPSCDPVIRMNLQQRSSQTEEVGYFHPCHTIFAHELLFSFQLTTDLASGQGIRWLHSELLEVKKLSVEQMRKNIYAHYDILTR